MTKPPRLFLPGRANCLALGLTFAALIVPAIGPSAQAQAAPRITSVSPADGATGVAVTSPLVFTFDLEMDDSVEVIPSFPPFLVGNLDFEPAGTISIQDLTAEWSADKRTLTCNFTKDLPSGTTITWKMNPAGTFFPISSADGENVATTTGNFTTAGGAVPDTTPPTLLAAEPQTGTTNFPIDSKVTFTFSEAMQPTPSPAIAWTASGASAINPANFTYTWESAGHALSCRYPGNFPTNALVSWTLNPAGAANPLKDVAGNPLATAVNTGSFTTSGAPCAGDGGDEGNGAVVLGKTVSYDQKSDAEPVLAAETPALFNAIVSSPDTNAVTAAVLKTPTGSSSTLSNLFGPTFMIFGEFQTQTALDDAWPGGTYTAEITRTTGPKVTVPVSFPAAYPPTPHIVNYPEAQAVDPAQPFVLKWNGIPGATTNDFISLSIHDGQFSWHAPEPCIPRPLPPSATSIEIPAGTLARDTTYTCELMFVRGGVANLAVKDFPAFASLSKQVNFPLKTSSGTVAPPTFTKYMMLADGQFELTLKGDAGRTYLIERTSALGTTWTTAATKQAGADGLVVYKDPRVGDPPRMFYRAKVQP